VLQLLDFPQELCKVEHLEGGADVAVDPEVK